MTDLGTVPTLREWQQVSGERDRLLATLVVAQEALEASSRALSDSAAPFDRGAAGVNRVLVNIKERLKQP